MTAHALDDGDHALVIDLTVAGNFHDGSGDVLGRGRKAGAVVGSEEVIVDGLGHAEHAALVADLLHIAVDLVAGVHGVVAAVVEEIADVVLLEDLKDALVVGVVRVGIGDLIAAGTEGRGRGVEHLFQLLGVLFVHDHQAVVQNADDAVERAVNGGDAFALKGSLDDAVSAGVDNCGRAAGLADDGRADQGFLVCHRMLPPF